MQFEVAQQSTAALAEVWLAAAQASAISEQLQHLGPRTKDNPALNATRAEFEQRLAKIAGPPFRDYGLPVTPLDTDQTSLRHLVAAFGDLQSAVESADAAPTREQEIALKKNQAALESTRARWQQLLTRDLANLNARLKQAGMTEIRLENDTK
jgi:hypothetical protein